MTTLGRSRLDIGRAALGCAQLGNLYSAIDDERARSIVDAAWDSGIRYFDTAPHYGLGLSERRLGAALAGRDRDSFAISTKVGRLLVPDAGFDGSQRDDDGFDVAADLLRRPDYSADGVRRSLDASLERLGLDRVDLVLVHDPDFYDTTDQAIAEAAPALERLRDEGVISTFGVGTRSLETIERFATETSADTVMMSGRFTLLTHDALESVLPTCLANGVGVLNVGVFSTGILAAPRPLPDAHFDYLPASRELLARVNAIAGLCDEFGTTLPRIAVEFALSHRAIAAVVLGAGDAAQAIANAAVVAEPTPPRALWERLAEAGLMDASALDQLALV